MRSKTLGLGRPLVVLTLIELITIAVTTLWRIVVPNPAANYLLILCPLACLEGLYSARLIQAQNLQTPDIWKFHAVELIGLALLIKLSAALSSADFAIDLLALDPRTVVGAGMTLVLWLSMLETAQDFQHLDNPPAPALDSHGDYVSPLARLTARYFVGGVIMLAATGVTGFIRVPITSLIPVMLAYFVIGLLYLPALRLQVARREWHSLGIQTTDRIAMPWMQAGIVVVILAALIAILLPMGYLNGLLDFFRNLVSILGTVVTFLISLIVWLITVILRPLLGTPDEQQPAPPPMPQLPPVANPESSGPNQFLELLPKIVLVVVVGYIVISYFRDHPELWAIIKKMRLVRILRDFWIALQQGLGSLRKGIRIRLPAALPMLFRRRDAAVKPFRFIRLNALSARDRVLYFYLSTLRRAEEQGIPRAPAQTPHEYSETLKPNLPEGQEELEHLSDAFVEARYSRHAIEPAEAKQVQTSWERVKQALRNVKKNKG